MPAKTAAHDRITQQIIAALEQGTDEFVLPWHRNHSDLFRPINAQSGRSYRGINILSLWVAAEASNYKVSQWATYRQWSDLGAQVRKGEKGTQVFLWKPRQSDENDEGGTDRPRFVARAFTVFNAAQVEGYTPQEAPRLSESERIAAAESFFSSVGATIDHGGDCACYSPGLDAILMPEFGRFQSALSYYAVLAHEHIHWTGAAKRLDREGITGAGSKLYAFEELVAELGAAFLCAHLGLPTEPRSDHAPYVASWLQALGSDPRALLRAASQAQAAVDYLEGVFTLAAQGR